MNNKQVAKDNDGELKKYHNKYTTDNGHTNVEE